MGSIIGYVVTAIVTFVLTLVLANWDEIRRDWNNKKARRKKQNLVKGVPKRVVQIQYLDEIFSNRASAFYINGQSFFLSDYIHCNEDGFSVFDFKGDRYGTIYRELVREIRSSGARRYVERLVIRYNHASYEVPAENVIVKVIKEVY